jgi:hypothetical protein
LYRSRLEALHFMRAKYNIDFQLQVTSGYQPPI